MSSVKDLVHARTSQYTSSIIPLSGVTDCLHLKTTFKLLVISVCNYDHDYINFMAIFSNNVPLNKNCKTNADHDFCA